MGLISEEQAELDALAELDRIFTYINAQLALAQGKLLAHECFCYSPAGGPHTCLGTV